MLSVDGVEHVEDNPYEGYFASDRTFRGVQVRDDRLPAKAPIYAFHLDGNAWAAPFEAFAGGAAFEVGGTTVFLFRPEDAELFLSTVAYRVDEAVTLRAGAWTTASGATFDPGSGTFVGEGADRPRRLGGFDTFWANWSLTNPSTAVLGGEGG